MSRILYYQYQYVAFHQAKPADDTGATAFLTVPGTNQQEVRYPVATSFDGDNNHDAFDYLEFKIGTLTFTPQDVNAKQAIQVEGHSGPQFIDFPVWKSTVVPDSYVIPTPPTDTTPPQLVSFTPADNSTGVPVNTNLTFTFNEPVQGFPGSIEIHKSDGTRVANIATLDTSQVSFSGAVVTVNPANDLAAGSDYYVIVTAGSIQDTAGNFFAGLTNPTTFNFTTVGQTNRPPVGVADTITVTGTAPVSKNILANDSDPDGDAIIITGITSQPTEGSVTFNSSGALTYQPNSNLTPADAGPDGYIHDQFGVQISDGHGGTAVEMVSADIFIQHYVVNLNTVGVPSMPNLPHPTRSPVQPIGAGPSPLKGDGNPLMAYGYLAHGQDVTYDFKVNPFYTLYLDYREEAQFADGTYVDSPNTTPWLRSDTSNLRSVFSIDQGFGRGLLKDLRYLGGEFSLHVPEARWYEDPLMPGTYHYTISNSEFDKPPGSQNYPVDYFEAYAWLARDDAGNNPYWARNLGTISGSPAPRPSDPDYLDRSMSYAEYVSRVDDKDYYSFTLAKPGAVAIALVTDTSTAGDNVIHLYADDVDSVTPMGLAHYLAAAATPYRDVQTTANNLVPLPAGTYYFSVEKPTHTYDLDANYRDGVQQSEEERVNYKVFVTVGDDNAGNDPEHALDLNRAAPTAARNPTALDNKTVTYNDSVSLADPHDLYTFSVSQPSTIKIDLANSNPSFDVGLELIRFNPIDLSILPLDNNFRQVAPFSPDGRHIPATVQLVACTWFRGHRV